MKPPSFIHQAGLAVLAGVTLVTPAFAAVNIDYVTVGNAGNLADPSTGYGAVSYEYKIGKYEVTNAQYGAFLSEAAKSDPYGLYNSNMASYGITRNGNDGEYTYSVTGTLANRPVVYVSWYDAARFANWLVNGQGSGSTETGAYTLTGNSGIITANAGAQFHIPTEDEWYKAAYYNGATGAYSLYPNGQNTITTADANYWPGVGSSTDVGSYSGDASAYGTFDQGGNVWEWNDAVFSGLGRGLRGGSWDDIDSCLASSFRNSLDLSFEYSYVGFRVASVPEPSAMVLTMLFSASIATRRKR